MIKAPFGLTAKKPGSGRSPTLVTKYEATLLLVTPTFLTAYYKPCGFPCLSVPDHRSEMYTGLFYCGSLWHKNHSRGLVFVVIVMCCFVEWLTVYLAE